MDCLDLHHDGAYNNSGEFSDPNDVEWIIQYNINRSSEGIEGGEIQIAEKTGKIIEQKLLSKPLDGYFIKDASLKHGATAINIKEGSKAVRDIVVLSVRKKTAIPKHS